MKSPYPSGCVDMLMSLPARGARIEISKLNTRLSVAMSLPARGARIEINQGLIRSTALPSRSPQGERGLKSFEESHSNECEEVAPRKGSAD